MYTLIRSTPWQAWLAERFPPLALALVLADRLYRFHSFALECLAFLATWFLFDLAASRLFRRRGEDASAPGRADLR